MDFTDKETQRFRGFVGSQWFLLDKVSFPITEYSYFSGFRIDTNMPRVLIKL